MTTHGLNFQPAERTRGGYEYIILGEIPEPAVYSTRICGAVKSCDKWQAVRWDSNGSSTGGISQSEWDLVPMEKHEWINVYDCGGGACLWRVARSDKREPPEKTDAAYLFTLHIVHGPDGAEYEIVRTDDV